ncbi:MAG TPA: SPFH domain-containing protein [Candidatus Nanoarchaeia archaeon]|nr:SPFH domain-containing protein [Candidatus Nanoarchaeia archaeon]
MNYQNLRNKVGAAGLAALLTVMPGCRSAGDTEYGVVYCKWLCSGEKATVAEPGTYNWVMPVKSQWFSLSTAKQFFYMTADPSVGDRNAKDDLEFKTKEGNDIGQDVVLEWGIDPTKMQYVVENVGTDMKEIQEKIVRPLARSIIRDSFGKMTSVQFYDGNSRFEAAKQARETLAPEFAFYGLKVYNVEAQEYHFNPTFQQAIDRAQNAKENKSRFDRKQAAVTEEWAAKLEQQRGQSNQTIAQSEGYFLQKENQAEGDYANRVKEGQVELAKKKAEAGGIEQRNKAMMSRGGKYAVQAAFAENWKPETITILPCEEGKGNNVSMSVTDINALIGGYNALKK